MVGGIGESSVPVRYQPRRVRRTRLQSGLVTTVPEGIIHLNKGVASVENILDGGVKIKFQDGTETIVDLVVGADGIRSVSPSHWYIKVITPSNDATGGQRQPFP